MDSVFSHGKLYVATTRASHPDNVKYFIKSTEEGVRNVVFKTQQIKTAKDQRGVMIER